MNKAALIVNDRVRVEYAGTNTMVLVDDIAVKYCLAIAFAHNYLSHSPVLEVHFAASNDPDQADWIRIMKEVGATVYVAGLLA